MLGMRFREKGRRCAAKLVGKVFHLIPMIPLIKPKSGGVKVERHVLEREGLSRGRARVKRCHSSQERSDPSRLFSRVLPLGCNQRTCLKMGFIFRLPGQPSTDISWGSRQSVRTSSSRSIRRPISRKDEFGRIKDEPQSARLTNLILHHSAFPLASSPASPPRKSASSPPSATPPNPSPIPPSPKPVAPMTPHPPGPQAPHQPIHRRPTGRRRKI